MHWAGSRQHKLNPMKNVPNRYAPGKQTSRAMTANPGTAGSDVSGSRGIGDADKDPDIIGDGENMATGF